METSFQSALVELVAESEAELEEQFYARGWTDGLPVVPPTPARVAQMLTGTRRPPDSVVAHVAPRWGKATVEKIAVNAVMAGCRPEYMPVIIAAIEAMQAPRFNLFGLQATTHVAAPLIIVHGPIAHHLGVNGGAGCLGQGWRANATIGRAVRLVLINIGGGYPGQTDQATFGHPGKYSYCTAEDPGLSPWESMLENQGLPAGTDAVTVFGAEAPHNINDHGSRTGGDVLLTIAHTMATPGANFMIHAGRPLLVLGPEHAHMLHREGFSKADVREFLFQHARVDVKAISPGQAERIRDVRPPEWYEEFKAGQPVAIVNRPEDFMIMVAGGHGKHSLFIPGSGSFWPSTAPITDIAYRAPLGTP